MEQDTLDHDALRASLLRTRRKQQLSIGGAIIAVAIAWGAWLWSPGDQASSKSGARPAIAEPAIEPTPPSSTPAPVAAPTQAPSWRAQPAAAPDARRATLAASLGSDNAGVRIEALRAARDASDVAVLPQLLALDPAADPDVAPTLVDAIAKLARKADPVQRAAAAGRLQQVLRSELARSAEHTDARGNLSVIVEALGTLASPESTAALSEALDSPRLPVHVGTVAIQSLSQLGDPAARAAVERFRDHLKQLPAATGFERELRDEAAQAADQALARLDR